MIDDVVAAGLLDEVHPRLRRHLVTLRRAGLSGKYLLMFMNKGQKLLNASRA